ncbi:MAG TPA: aspartate--tRNA ligase [Sandaracinaceae bacterium LLY-WYZ-13_1]|nr:aspartate--tRNA ligase [Sandaracinaceae bacterium LLY-WYZ-13_1]
MARFIDELKRTHSCGELRLDDADSEVVLMGWVQRRHDRGGVVFVDLRDREGFTQVTFDKQVSEDAFAVAEEVRNEFVLAVRGKVRDRGEQRNDRVPTGAIEVLALEAEILNRAEPPVFPIQEEINANEETRLSYRYLDLRRPHLQRNLKLRADTYHHVRNHFAEHGFLEVETPFMVKYTPGGARNFLVPSRHHLGKFYALAESPQLFKQLLMVAGYDKYFQITRCFRDEDLRGDRQPEFTQIDVEMSFVAQDDVFDVCEKLVMRLWKEVLGVDLREHYPDGTFPRLRFDESMAKYGNDKPDLRFGLPHTDLTELTVKHGGGGIALLEPIAKKFADGTYRLDLPEEIVKAIRVPAEHALSRKQVDELEGFVKQMGAKGLGRAKVNEGGAWTQSPFAKQVTDGFRDAINGMVGAVPGDLILLMFGEEQLVHTCMANLRVHLGKKLGMIPEVGAGGEWRFLWVVDPPLFERGEETGEWVAAHHPFTRPHDEHVALIEEDPGKVLCYRYDLVLNGVEIAGGSIRLHDSAVQEKVFAAMGLSDEEAQEKFSFLLEGLRYGAPPHGGIAFGLDRLTMLMAGAESLRDVIAFPKTARGNDLMMGAPGPVDARQLEDVRVRSTAGDDD